MREALRIAVELCKRFEGFSSAAYTCPAGVPTIGYGSTFYEDGRRVTLQDKPITKTEAELMLIRSLSTQYLPAVLKASPTLINNPNALGAILSFSYNLGISRYRASTLRKKIDVANWDAASEEIVKWNKANGKTLAGLVKRRAAEREYFQ